MNESKEKFSICPCQHCNGDIEFDDNQLEVSETQTVECPHCHLETIIFIPRITSPSNAVKLKSGSKMAVISILVFSMIALLSWFAIHFNRSSDSQSLNEPMAAPTYGLSPITAKLQNSLISVLHKTDDLDAIVKRDGSRDEYVAVATVVEKAAINLVQSDKFPPATDPRIFIFESTIKRYDELGMKIANGDKSDELYAADTIAGMNKQLLLEVLNGTLASNEETMFNDLKKQIQAGKTSEFFDILFKPMK